MSARTKELFLDWHGIWPGATGYDEDGTAFISEAPQEVRLAVQPAAITDPVVVLDKPWEGTTPGYVTARCDEGKYRMWYGCKEGLAYAESDDGFAWTKPELDLVDHEGSRANNLVLDRSIEGSVFLDPAAPESERYKLVTMQASADRKGTRLAGAELERALSELEERGIPPAEIYGKELKLVGAVHGAVSPDGLRWTFLDEPLFEKFCDTQNVVLYDEDSGKYVGYWRSSAGRRRSIARSETADFRHWPQPDIVLQPDGDEPPTDDYYTNGYSPYPGSGDFHLMFPAIYRRLLDCVEVRIAVSRDGFNWSWPERKPVIPPSHPYKGGIYPGPGLVPLDGERWGLICRGEEELHNESYYYEPERSRGEIRWATWTRDRLVALEAAETGRVTLNQLPASGAPLLLNCQTAPNGWIRVELIEPTLWPPAHLEPMEGYSFADCAEVRGDHLEAEVSWNGTSDLSPLKGRDLCLRIELCRARLFSVSL